MDGDKMRPGHKFNESPMIVPSTPLSSLGGDILTNKEKKELANFVHDTQGVYELALFHSGDVIPTEYVLHGMPQAKEDTTSTPTTEHEQSVWINAECLVLYLAWEQCWYLRNSDGETLPIRAVDLYKIVYNEYCGLDRTGLVKPTYLESEQKRMRNEKEEDIEEEKDKSKDLTELGLPEINQNTRDTPFTMKELEERKNNRKTDVWWKNVPKGAKAHFSMRFPEFVDMLRSFERMGYLTIRPLVSYKGGIQETTMNCEYPCRHLSVFFSTEKGLELWKSFITNSPPIASVMLRYHRQRQKRYVYLSEVELLHGEIYEDINKQAGDPHESGMDAMRNNKRRKEG